MATKAIPVVAAKIPATASNFPVYIKPSLLTGWGSLTLAEAQSSRFYSDEGKTTELAREVVSADEIHVKVASLTTTTIIYCDYDGIRADYAVTDTHGRNAVWSDYKTVVHCEQSPASGGSSLIDSTGNYTMASFGSMVAGDSVAAKMGNGLEFDGTQFIEIGATGNFDLAVSQQAVWSVWAKRDANNKSVGSPFGYEGTHDQNRFIRLYFRSDGKVKYEIRRNDATNENTADSSTVYNDTDYHLLHYVRGTNTQTIYVNGASSVSASVSTAQALSGLANEFTFGAATVRADAIAGANWAFGGILDEVRVRYSFAPSSNWVTTEYNNQDDVATFFGTVTDVGGGGAPATNGFKFFF